MDLMAMASAWIATGLLATSTARLAATTWSACANRRRDRIARNCIQTELTRATEHVRLASQLHRRTQITPQGGWQVMEVVETQVESDDCLSIYLQDPLHPDRCAEFTPGQFMLVRPALGGSSLPSRCYSLSDCPGQPWWRLTVKRQKPSNAAASSLSCWMHDFLQPGDCLLVSGPHGQFTLPARSQYPLLLLAAGVGVTPILSMLKSCLATQTQRPINVMYQVSDDRHWPFGQTMHHWCAQFPNLDVSTYMSRQTELPDVPAGQVRAGKFQPADVLENWTDNAHILMCGPQNWMDAITAALLAGGVPHSQIHSESFTGESSGEAPSAVEPYSIEFARSQLITPTANTSTTLWQAAKEAGLVLPAGCHSGACGSCKLKLLSGEVKYRNAPTCTHTTDQAVACIAQPVGHVVVDA